MTPPDIVLVNRYRLLSVLGKGGQATVFHGEDLSLKVGRAIKLLHPEQLFQTEARKRFELEAQTMAKIEHPNIVRLFDIVATEEHLFIVMEYVAGGNLWQWIKSNGKMPERMACEILLPIVAAVHTLHQNGIIHRDIKPSNILIDRVQQAAHFRLR